MELVVVRDIWGRLHRVSREQLEDTARVLLRMHGKNGYPLHVTKRRSVVYLHRANISASAQPVRRGKGPDVYLKMPRNAWRVLRESLQADLAGRPPPNKQARIAKALARVVECDVASPEEI